MAKPFFSSLAAAVKSLRKKEKTRRKRNAAARAKREVYDSLGMKRVRGALGGIYYE